MSHEQSITIDVDGLFYNIPTVHKGKKLTDDEAFDLFSKGVIKPLGPSFKTLDEALRAAKKRSEAAGAARGRKHQSEMLRGLEY